MTHKSKIRKVASSEDSGKCYAAEEKKKNDILAGSKSINVKIVYTLNGKII